MRRMTVVVLLAACVVVAPASASNWLQLGLVDTTEAIGNTPRFSQTLQTLRPQIVRVNLFWGGVLGVARERPDNGTNPEDRGVRVGSLRRRGDGRLGARRPCRLHDLRHPVVGERRRAAEQGAAEHEALARVRLRGRIPLQRPVPAAGRGHPPRVSLWTAWNEPNLPLGLKPQWRKINGRWVIQSARDYARICNAIYEGVHPTLLRGQKVACGVTAARKQRAGDEAPIHLPDRVPARREGRGDEELRRLRAPSVRGRPAVPPRSARPRNPRAITFANIGKLIDEVTILYGEPIWITEYGYETSPPDRIFGVSWDRQATYMHEAYTIARRNPRIDMLLWFLVRDEGGRPAGSQASCPPAGCGSPRSSSSSGSRRACGATTSRS